MEWWSHLWLNEGYASFTEYLCVDHLFPKFDIWSQFMSFDLFRALELDALHNSHPIEVAVNHPNEVDEIFDAISYCKGASVIRMLYHWLGDDVFRRGMSLYLNRHKYGNAVTEDLWSALADASGKPVALVMTTWTKQKGFPVIAVDLKLDDGQQKLILRQEKFCADGNLPSSEKDALWMVPITMTTHKSRSQIGTLLETRETEVPLDGISTDDFVKVNSEFVGPYRVAYSSQCLKQLTSAVVTKTLSPIDRLNIENDLFALVQSGRKSTSDYLDFLSNYAHEEDLSVWSSINNGLGKLNTLLSHSDLRPKYHKFGRRLLSPIFAKLGWDARPNESHQDGLLRSRVIARLVAFQYVGIITEANNRFEAHIKGIKPIPADLRSAVYKAVASTADGSKFDQLLNEYRKAELHEEKIRIVQSLGSVGTIQKLEQVLEFAMSSEVRAQDAIFVIIAVSLNSLGRDTAWNFFKTNKDELRSRYEGGPLLTRLIKSLAENFASLDKVTEIEQFFEQNSMPGTERTVQQALESVRLNCSWLERDFKGLEQFLSSC